MQVKQLGGLYKVLTKLLLLEDDLLFGETLVDLLEDEGFRVSHFTNGQDALNATYEDKFDLYLLDINVPIIKGTTLLHDLRDANDKTPAIFLTSHKDKEMLKEGFSCGGDDYLSKPFDTDELLLRVKALLRRMQVGTIINVGKLAHDKVHKTIFYEDKELELSKKEYQLLVLLMNHINSVVPKELIIDELWSSSEAGSDGAIRVYITRLKHLLSGMSVENIRGVGYKLVP